MEEVFTFISKIVTIFLIFTILLLVLLTNKKFLKFLIRKSKLTKTLFIEATNEEYINKDDSLVFDYMSDADFYDFDNENVRSRHLARRFCELLKDDRIIVDYQTHKQENKNGGFRFIIIIYYI